MAGAFLGLQESSIHTSADMPAILGANPAPQVLIRLRIESFPAKLNIHPVLPLLIGGRPFRCFFHSCFFLASFLW